MHDPSELPRPKSAIDAGRIYAVFFLLVPLASGTLAAVWGMDANWDLRNYHYYNPYAFLTGRIGWDLLVSQIPSFFNPALDIPYYLAAQILPARALAFLLGVIQGVNFIPLAMIASRVLVIDQPVRRAALSCAIALVGVTGAATLSETGTVFYDTFVSLGVFSSALAVVGRWPLLMAGPLAEAALMATLAGLPVGLAFGLKQPTVVFAFGLCSAMLLVPGNSLRRLLLAFCFGVGVLAGLSATGGFWMWHLWESYRNPLFPFFNHIFQSSWALPLPYRDPAYLPDNLIDRLGFLFAFSFDSKRAGEIVIQDFRVLAAALAMIGCGIASLIAKRRAMPILIRRGPALYLIVAAAVSYAAWLWLFCIYRYLIPLEMMAPVVAAACIGLLPIGMRARLGAIGMLLVFLAATTRTDDWIRVPFQAKPVSATVPPIAQPDRTIVLIAGHEPLSFLIPSFPPAMRFLRIDSTFTNWQEQGNAFNILMRTIVDQHQGPIAALFIPTERNDVVLKYQEYGLAIVPEACSPVSSPIGAEIYSYCPLKRISERAP